MSQLASFTYMKASDVPFLGFWSKPKPRLFRKPECKFTEFLHQHALRESVFDDADGVYVALVLARIESQDERFSRETDPVVETVRKHIGGSHWLVKFRDRRLATSLDRPLPETDWPSFLSAIGGDNEMKFEWCSFDAARRHVLDRLLELQEEEALLISVG